MVKFRVELVWKESEDNAASSIFLTSDGRVVLQGRALSAQERARWVNAFKPMIGRKVEEGEKAGLPARGLVGAYGLLS